MGEGVQPRGSGGVSGRREDQDLEGRAGKAQGIECFGGEGASSFGDQQVDFVLEAALDLEDLHAVLGFEGGVALFFEAAAKLIAFCKGQRREAKHDVAHDLGAWNGDVVVGGAVLKEGEIEANFGAEIFLRTQIHPSAELAKSAVDQSEAHAAALCARVVGGERFDGDLLEVVRDTTSFVLNRDADVRSGRDA